MNRLHNIVMFFFGGIMKGFRTKAVLQLSAVLALFVSFASWATESSYRPGQVLVRYRSGIIRNRSTMETLYKSVGVLRIKRFRGLMSGTEQLYLAPGASVESAVELINSDPNVEYAQPNYILKALPVQENTDQSIAAAPRDIPCLVPGIQYPPGCIDEPSNPEEPGDGEPSQDSRPALRARPDDVNPPVADPDVQRAYGLSRIGADRAWNVSRGDSNFVVAVIDTGIDYNHEDLAYNVWRNPNPGEKRDVVGYDFVHDDGIPFDDNSHGTHCAGVIGATGGNGIGVSGINQRVSIMALKFLDSSGSGDTAGAIHAIDYAIAHGAKVLSNSWGGGGEEDNRGLREAIERAAAQNILFVAAAGNDSSNNDTTASYPATFDTPNMISVASTDSNDRLSSFSNYGARSVHLAAPGSNVYSTVPGGQYRRMSGTSMACPHVAGAAALVWANNPNMTYAQVKARLLSSVDPIEGLRGKTVTGGRLNVFKALTGRAQ